MRSGMDTRPTPLERAFELAKSGQCATVDEIKKKLKTEGISADQLIGNTLTKQLRELIVAAMEQAPKR
jgi:hypothetical protein